MKKLIELLMEYLMREYDYDHSTTMELLMDVKIQSISEDYVEMIYPTGLIDKLHLVDRQLIKQNGTEKDYY